MPSVVPPIWPPWSRALAAAMNMGRLHAELLADLLKGNAMAVNAQSRTEVKVVCFLGFFAFQETPQRAEHLRIVGVRHTCTPQFSHCFAQSSSFAPADDEFEKQPHASKF